MQQKWLPGLRAWYCNRSRIRRPEDVNEAFERTVREQAQAMVILSSPLIFVERAHIAQSSFEKSAADDQSFQFVS